MSKSPFRFAQPDGTRVAVLVTGDEFYQEVTTPTGELLIRDADDWICYARVSDDGSELIATKVRYGVADSIGKIPPPPPLPPHAPKRISNESLLQKRDSVFRIMYPDGQALPNMHERFPPLSSKLKAPLAAPDTIYGITVLIDFSDQSSSVSRQEIDDLYNKTGYTGGGNNGSVQDYFYEVSNGSITYVNYVSDFVRALKPKSEYDNSSLNHQNVTSMFGLLDFLEEMLKKALLQGEIDVSKLTSDSRGIVRGVNFMYAGEPEAGWSRGLWPHKWQFLRPIDLGSGKKVLGYQMSNIGELPPIGTIVHENGHLLFGWDDLYHYSDLTSGAGLYCIMSGSTVSSKYNPFYPNPYFRLLQGWVDTVDITDHPKGSSYTLHDTSRTIFAYSGKNRGGPDEFYLIELKHRSGRNAYMKDGGLAIWHIDTTRDNKTSRPMDENGPFDLANIEQADGRYDLEKKRNPGDQTDLFRSNIGKTQFSDNTSPSARWHNGMNSQIDIQNISAYGQMMTFTLETDPKPLLWVKKGFGTGEYAAGSEVGIMADPVPNGEEFSSWSGKAEDRELLEDPNSPTTFLVMPERNVELTATYKKKKHRLDVRFGRGSGEYEAGKSVLVSADTPQPWEQFQKWEGAEADLFGFYYRGEKESDIYIMPERNVELTALYEARSPDGILMPTERGVEMQIANDTLFYDDGWLRPYTAFTSGELTLLPAIKGQAVGLRFTDLTLAPGDSLKILQDVDMPLRRNDSLILDAKIIFKTLSGEKIPESTIWSSASNGGLTVSFSSKGELVSEGWRAEILLKQPVAIEQVTGEPAAPLHVSWKNGALHLELLKAANVQVALYSLDGQQLASQNYGLMSTGAHQLQLPIKNLAEGSYWVKVQAGAKHSMLRIVR